MPDGISINEGVLDPVLLQLGVIAGLLSPPQGGMVTLNTAFFADPITHLKQIVSGHGADLAALLTQLMGSSSDSAHGLSGGPGGRQWIPIAYTDAVGKRHVTGFHVVVETPPAHPAYTILGVGVLAERGTGITVTPYAYAPLIAVGEGGVVFVLDPKLSGAPSHLEFGIRLEAASGALGAPGFSFDGFQLVATLPFDGLPQFDATVLNLAVADAAPADRALPLKEDSAAIETWISVCLALVAGRLKSDPTAANTLTALLAFLGGTGTVPAPDWTSIGQGSTVQSWLLAIATQPGAATAWLGALACMITGSPPGTVPVGGSGSETEPYTVPLGTLEKATVDFTLALTVDHHGTATLSPGLALSTPVVHPIPSAPVGAALTAAVTFAQIPLGGAAGTVQPFPRFALRAGVLNPAGGPLIQCGPDIASLTVGSFEAGVTYTAKGISPDFAILGVRTNSGQWPRIDLTNYDSGIKILKLLEDTIEEVVQTELQQLATKSEAGAVADALATLLGLVVPQGFTPTNWPASQGLLTTEAGMARFITNPLTAFGSYFALTLTGNNPVFGDLLPSAAVLLGAKPGAAIKGSGVESDPWQAIVHGAAGGPHCMVTAWSEPAALVGQQRLHPGLAIDVPVALSTVTAGFVAKLDLLDFVLPTVDGTGTASCTWVPGLGAQLSVAGPNGTSPSLGPIAGLTLGAQNLFAGLTWNRSQPLQWEAGVNGLSLTPARGQPIPLGNLLLGDMPRDSLKNDLAVLAQTVLVASGLELIRNGGRVGVALTCALGLLPNLPAIFSGPSPGAPIVLPQGFVLPAGWPTLSVGGDPKGFLTNPWPALAGQLQALLAGNNAAALMRLVAWAVTGTLPAASGSGTEADPWRIPLGWQTAAVALWKDTEGGPIDFGLALTLADQIASDVSITTTASLRLGQVAPDGKLAITPRLSLLCQVAPTATDTYLVGNPQTAEFPAVANLAFGIDVSASGIAPHLMLARAQVNAEAKPVDVSLVLGSSPPLFVPQPQSVSATALGLLIGETMTVLSAVAGSKSGEVLAAALQLLQMLHLAQSEAPKNPPPALVYSIVPSAWSALLANPKAYLEGELASVLADPSSGAALNELIATLLDATTLKLPSDLAAVPVALAGLGLMQSTPSGYQPLLSPWLKFLTAPATYLGTKLQALEASPQARKQLITALAPLLPANGTASWGPVTFTATPQGVLTVAIGRDTVVADLPVGGAAELTVDLATPALSLEILVAAPTTGQALSLGWSASGNDFTLALVPAGTSPAAFTQQLVPVPANFLDDVAENVLGSLLSTGLGAFITAEVLPRSPLLVRIMQALGLIATGAKGQPTVIGLRPAFSDPIGWLRDPSRLGNQHGEFDLSRIGALLKAVPGAGISGPDGLKLQPSGADGLALAGLPFGVSVQLNANDTAGLTVGLDLAPKDSFHGVSINASVAAAFAKLAAPAISGQATATWVFEGGNGQIAPSVQFGSTIAIQATGHFGEGAAQTIALLPFGGWNQVLAGLEGQLLPEIAQWLWKAWSEVQKNGKVNHDLVEFVDAVIATGQALDITADNYMSVLKQIENGPLDWLKQTFTGTGGATAIENIVGLLAAHFKIDGVTTTDGVLQYKAPLPKHLPGNLTLQFGSKPPASFTLSSAVQLQKGKFSAAFDAGLTVPTDGSAVVPNFASSIALDLGSAAGGALVVTPTLRLAISEPLAATSLAFYPTGFSTDPDVLRAEILPHPNLAPGTAADWIKTLATQFAVPLIADAALTSKEGTKLLATHLGTSSVTLGGLLASAQLIETSTGGGYQLADVAATYGGKNPAAIAELLVGSALDVFPAGATPIITLHDGNSIDLAKVPALDKSGTNYGVSLLFKGIELSAGARGKLLLQVGDLFGADPGDSWLTHTGAPASLSPGLDLYFLKVTNGSHPSYSFHFGLGLGSVGLDYVATGKSLFNVEGVTVQSMGLRLALSLDQSLSGTVIGGAARVDGIGIPLGPSLSGSNQSKNPVAQSLLASGRSKSASGAGAVNPTFGATLGYVHTAAPSKLYFALRPDGAAGAGSEQPIWLDVERAFGPLHCRKIELGPSDTGGVTIFDVGFDGSVALAGLTIDLQQLSVGIPLGAPTDIHEYSLSLQGLSVAYSGGPVQITGALLHAGDAYTGELQVTTAPLCLTALGSYGTTAQGAPSLFAYVLVPTPIGGPPCFFVTGLAGGFGYNRDFIVPTVNKIAAFPLVAWSTSPGTAPTTGSDALKQLERVAPILQGADWLAAGVCFTSFELLNTTALLVCRFGTGFQLDLLGTSALTLPKGSSSPAAYAELELEVVLDVTAGFLKAEAVLTPNSYVIDKACHLTGGFAFYSWFSDQPGAAEGKGAPAGDFVLTLGGYFSEYQPPSWYPQQADVPRLGFSWLPGSGVYIGGGAYFALTPSCVMAGAKMDATYSSGSLSAWFDAYADFLVNWHPFHYQGDAGLSIGVSVTVHIIISITITVELSATLVAEGPPFSGELTVHFWVVSFTIPVGARDGGPTPSPLDWDHFSSYFLPPPKATHSINDVAAAAPSPVGWLKLSPLAGRLSTPKGDQDPDAWVIDPATFEVQIASVVPLTAMTFDAKMQQASFSGPPVGIHPMSLQGIEAAVAITLTGPSDNARWIFMPVTQAVPAALWGTGPWQPVPDGTVLTGEQTVAGCLLGATGHIGPPPKLTGPPVMELTDLLSDTGTLCAIAVAITSAADPAPPEETSAPDTSVIHDSVMQLDTIAQRGDIAAAAALAGLDVSNGRLDVLAADAALMFQQPPMLGSVTGTGHRRSRETPAVPRRAERAAADVAPVAPVRPAIVAAYRAFAGSRGLNVVEAIRAHPRLRRIDAAALTGMGGDGATRAMVLQAGGGAVWRLPPGQPRAVKTDGALAVRAVALGRDGWPIQDELLAADESARHHFPAESIAAALFALTPASAADEAWAGWGGDRPLLQIAGDCLAAHRSMVRLQAPVARGRGHRRHDLGAWRGDAMVAHNLVQGLDGTRPGWIMTMLPAGTAHLAILLTPGNAALGLDADRARAALDLAVFQRRRAGGARVPVEPAGVLAYGGRVALLFRIDPAIAEALNVRTAVAAEYRLDGVIGAIDSVDAAALSRALGPADPLAAGAPQTRIAWLAEAA